MTLLNRLFSYQNLRAAGLAGLIAFSSMQFGCEQSGGSSNDSNVETNYSGNASGSDRGSSNSDDSGYNGSNSSGGSGMIIIDANSLSGASCSASTRGNASGASTLLFGPGSSAVGSVGLKPNKSYDVVVRYSDNDGLSTLNLDINGSNIGSVSTAATRGVGEPNGTGWNVFTTAYVGSFTTDSSGKYNLGVSSSGDPFGVELDTITFAEK
jgi:hypothetical protein